MIDRSIFHERFVNAYNYLLDNGIIHNQLQLAKALGKVGGDISRSLRGEGRVLTQGLMERLAKAYPDHLNPDYLLDGVGEIGKVNGIPHIPFEVAAGGVATALGSATISDCELRPTNPLFSSYDFTIEVSGESMSPYIQHGDILACKFVTWNAILTHPTRCFVIDTPDGAVVKHLKVDGDFLVCSSINPSFASFRVPIVDGMRFAMVVGITRAID